jgi:hypothetical protein
MLIWNSISWALWLARWNLRSLYCAIICFSVIFLLVWWQGCSDYYYYFAFMISQLTLCVAVLVFCFSVSVIEWFFVLFNCGFGFLYFVLFNCGSCFVCVLVFCIPWICVLYKKKMQKWNTHFQHTFFFSTFIFAPIWNISLSLQEFGEFEVINLIGS